MTIKVFRVPGESASRSLNGHVHNDVLAPATTSFGRNVAIALGLAGIISGAAGAKAGDPVARDMAAAVGLSYHGARLGGSWGDSVVFDYDLDGDPDLLVNAHGSTTWPLMRNKGNGTFKEVLQGTFYQQDRHGCVSDDFGSPGGNGLPDGLPDIYCMTGACRGTCTKEYPNSLFLQRPDHTYVDVARSWGVADPHSRGRDALVIDYNRDGLLDLVLANTGPSIYGAPNRLFKNVGGRFKEVVDPIINQQLYSECVAAGDINGDGWTDLIFCGSVNPARKVVTYLNKRGKFVDVTSGTAYKKRAMKDLVLADVNGDRRPDLLMAEYTRFSVWLNVAGKFPKVNYTYSLNQGGDIAVGDVNLDGKPDVLLIQVTNSKYPHIMLINDGNGVSYHRISIPRVSSGNGDTANAIPNWNGTGRTAFLVTNGKWGVPGPIELLVFSAR